jgi:SpoVK/Ycf46/Vps4 family AAA+-type ATPase
MLGTMLTWMQDKQVTGMLLVGPPGAAKSAFAKSLGNTAGVPTIAFDFSGMKGSLVGESGRNLRQALKVVDAVSQGRALVVATCNSLGTLPPELRRRFKFGTFFFDLPTAKERAKIWEIYGAKYRIISKVLKELPADEGWTGAEIASCCEIAYRLKISLVEAARFIVPVAKSAAESIDKLREQASGRFISASEPGVYRKDRPAVEQATPKKRAIEVGQ